MTQEDEAFRAEIREFVSATLPAEISRRTLLGYHPHKPDVVWWTQRLDERGWAVAEWPREFGGPGWSVRQRRIFDEECFLAGCPAVNPQAVHLVGPVIYTFGNDAQKAQFLPAIRQGQVWAQGFSEPNAGSDLAALQTRAVREGDAYVVNGQKIWTSEAHYADWLFLLARTSTEGRPQAGISFLLVDMKSPGITVRPIVSIDGGHILNEVFFDNVEVPAANLVGEENSGWAYAKQLLAKERTFSAEVARCKGLFARLREIAAAVPSRGRPLVEDAHFARRLGQLEIDLLAHETTLWRVISEEEAGLTGGRPTASILKVTGTELIQRIGAMMVEALGDGGLPYLPESQYLFGPPADAPGHPLAPGVVADFLYRRSATIYGGSNEVQRNIIAAQLLS